MADYWKSQARKFCDFCKCWIADNKPSIQFHETGKRHKENVAQKLALLTKRSVKEQKASLKVDEAMRKMEEAAMKAYMKDMESNPDYTSKLIIEKVEEKKKQLENQEQSNVTDKEDSDQMAENDTKEIPSCSVNSEVQKLWYEAVSDEGYTYYWNYSTGASVWEPPSEGYVSLAEQEEETSAEPTEAKTSSKSSPKKNDDGSTVKKDKEIEIKKESLSKDNRKRKKEIEEDDTVVVGPTMKPDPYGGWTTVEKRVPEQVDLQLPQQDYIEIKVPTLENEQPRLKFKEKMITKLDDVGKISSIFKKRKCNAKSNMRQKIDDDE